MPGVDQGVAPVLAPGQLGKSGAKGRAQSAEFHKDNFAFPFSFFTVRTPSRAATVEQSDNCLHSSK